MKNKKMPERMCVSCREMKPKNQLVRIVNTLDGVKLDTTGKLQGRGVYLCPCKTCIERALKSKGFARANGFSLEAVAADLESIIEQQN